MTLSEIRWSFLSHLKIEVGACPHGVLQVCLLSTELFQGCKDGELRDIRIPPITGGGSPPHESVICLLVWWGRAAKGGRGRAPDTPRAS